MNNSISKITKSFDSIDKNYHFPATELYSEGWLLRLTLEKLKNKELNHPKLDFTDDPCVDWYSEGQLLSPFKSIYQQDKSGEGQTRVDGIIANYKIRTNTKSGIELSEKAKHLIVLEAKINSNLSQKTTNIPNNNQATRIVACMLNLIINSEVDINSMEKIAFYIIVPNHNNKFHNFDKIEFKTTIKDNIIEKLEEYTKKSDRSNDSIEHYTKLLSNIEKFFEKIEIDKIEWEEIIEQSNIIELKEIYKECICQKNLKKYDGIRIPC